MLYGGSSEASPEPYKDAGKDHWRKVVVSVSPCMAPSTIIAVEPQTASIWRFQACLECLHPLRMCIDLRIEVVDYPLQI